jgi:DNA-binding MarR family transcriptional regulator
MPKTLVSRKPPKARESALRSWLSVVRAYNLCDALMARRLADEGVRVVEHEILANLRREPGLTQNALAQRCFTAKGHLSGLVSDLEQRGWLARESDPADARAKRLTLTPTGIDMADRTAALQAEVVAIMAADMSAAELDAVRAVMESVSLRLEQALAASP